MAIKYNNTDTKQVLFNDQVVKQLILDDAVVYCEQYALKVGSGVGVASVNVIRKDTSEPSASSGFLSNGDSIYYGDELEVSATAESGYKIDGTYPRIINVIGATTVNVTATLDMVIEPPTITITSVKGALNFQVTITFDNPNNKQMTCYYTYDVPTQSISDSGTVTVNGMGSSSINKQLPSNQGVISGTVTAYLVYREDTKTYTSSTTTKTFSVRGTIQL